MTKPRETPATPYQYGMQAAWPLAQSRDANPYTDATDRAQWDAGYTQGEWMIAELARQRKARKEHNDAT